MTRKKAPAKGEVAAETERPPTPRDEHRNPRDLKPYPGNARRHPPEQIEALAASFRQFGFVGRILIDDQDEIIAGHGRHEASIPSRSPSLMVGRRRRRRPFA